MHTTIQKWGNSHAVRIPKYLLEKTCLQENDPVEIKVEDGAVMIIPIKKHRTLQDRIAEYSGEYNCEEWDTGIPKGKEVL